MSFNRIKRVIESQAVSPRIKMNTETLADDRTLSKGEAPHQRFDPDGSARDITLPAEEGANGAWFEILNWAGGSENLVVKDDGGSTIVTISQNEKCTVVCDGSSWVHMGIITIALS